MGAEPDQAAAYREAAAKRRPLPLQRNLVMSQSPTGAASVTAPVSRKGDPGTELVDTVAAEIEASARGVEIP